MLMRLFMQCLKCLSLLIVVASGEMSEMEKFVDNIAGLNAQRDVETLSRIQNQVEQLEQEHGGSATPMDYFRTIVNDPEWQHNLWEDVWSMTNP